MNGRLLELLVKDGFLTADHARQALDEQRSGSETLPVVLRRLGHLDETALLDFLSRKYGLPVIALERLAISDEVVRLVRKDIAQKHQVFPIRRLGNTLTLAVSDPTVVTAVDDVQFATGLQVVPVLASEAAIAEAIEKHYVDNTVRFDQILKAEEQTGGDALEWVDRFQKVDLADVAGAGAAPIIRYVNLLLVEAIRQRASDVHLEPQEDAFHVRYRIDGVLHDMMAPPKQMESAIISRVKIMAHMDIAERRLPQDGRISVRFASKEVDLRVSSLPTILGEKIVIRILDKSRVVLDLEKLGFEPDDLQQFDRAIRTPYGMILVTGPTGSGKSTTLYAAVSAINSKGINILAAEDPVEYNLRGINQLHVRDDIGLSFSAALRSFLRQDPDVILVGEMRDTETAQIAIRAALTGHLVFSTLHTKDAASTVTRLVDMGIPPFLVSSSLLLVVAQRLCRRICRECRQPVELPLSLLVDVGFPPEEVESLRLFRGVGCSHCAHTGYQGRTALHEVLPISSDIQDAVIKQRSVTELKAIAIKHGMRSLRQAGLSKAARGITTLDEVIRVTNGD
jgi:type IV pilus assembly protein PilB